jgi:hypothetical protein
LFHTQATDYEISIMIALIYPAKAILSSKRNEKLGEPACPRLFENLGEEGIHLFKGIFENNNKDQRDEFFTHKLVKKLWPLVLKKLTYEHCFGRSSPNKDIYKTYRAIETELKVKYGLRLPQWWN